MKTYRMFTEDYVDAYSIHRTSTGPGMGQYVPTADLNASKKKKTNEELDQSLIYSLSATLRLEFSLFIYKKRKKIISFFVPRVRFLK